MILNIFLTLLCSPQTPARPEVQALDIFLEVFIQNQRPEGLVLSFTDIDKQVIVEPCRWKETQDQNLTKLAYHQQYIITSLLRINTVYYVMKIRQWKGIPG